MVCIFLIKIPQIMNKNSTHSFLIILLCLFGSAVYAACPMGNLTLSTQAEVDAFPANYPGCSTLNVNLTIQGADITNLDNLSGLGTINGTLLIQYSNALVDITGLSGIHTVNGELQFEECHALTSLAGLALTTCNKLEIQGMDALTDISQLSTLTAIGDDLHIFDCDALTNLNGLQNIASVGADLRIDQNENLTDLSALSTLTSVGGDVEITSNKNLANLDGLDNIASVGNNVVIRNNDNLTDCIGACKMADAALGTVTLGNNNSLQCNDINTFEADCLIALPVELRDFKGYIMERSNMLKWQTESEENTMVFLVERSLDGLRDFNEIGRVDAFGNSTSLRSYELEDANPVSLAYYRLRIVDFDGTFEYSDVIAVERSKTEIDLVEVYPVPAEEEVTILVYAKATGKAIITLSDFMGRKIKEEKVELNAGINRYTLNWEDRETNFYYLTIYNGNERIAKKILRASTD